MVTGAVATDDVATDDVDTDDADTDADTDGGGGGVTVGVDGGDVTVRVVTPGEGADGGVAASCRPRWLRPLLRARAVSLCGPWRPHRGLGPVRGCRDGRVEDGRLQHDLAGAGGVCGEHDQSSPGHTHHEPRFETSEAAETTVSSEAGRAPS